MPSPIGSENIGDNDDELDEVTSKLIQMEEKVLDFRTVKKPSKLVEDQMVQQLVSSSSSNNDMIPCTYI